MDSRKFQLFKTELCRNWQEMGICRYANKCRFAHGQEELRCVQRHAKYKTEICKTFHQTGTCLYGVRCTFIHDEHVMPSPTISSTSSSPPFTPSQLPNNAQFSLFGETDFTTWKPSPFTKWDAAVTSIWSTSFDRRYSSSSSSSSSSASLLTIPINTINQFDCY